MQLNTNHKREGAHPPTCQDKRAKVAQKDYIMPSTKKQINARVTQNEYERLLDLMELLELNQAETIRHCIKVRCAQLGIDIKDTMPSPGSYERGLAE